MHLYALPRLIDEALNALSSDRSEVGLLLEADGSKARLSIGGVDLAFGRDDISSLLAWERLADMLPGAVERSRLTAMHRAAGVVGPESWSVYTDAVVLHWLVWATGGRETSVWRDAMSVIVNAACSDGDIRLSFQTAAGQELTGTLRSRQLRATIRLSSNLSYRSLGAAFVTREMLPDTIASASAGRDIADLAEVPWLTGACVGIGHTEVDASGTVLMVRAPSLPLAPIPAAAMAAAPPAGPAHAPWIVARRERDALDALDAVAHRGG